MGSRNNKLFTLIIIFNVAIKKEIICAFLMLVMCGCLMSPIAQIVSEQTRDSNTERETIFIKQPPPDILHTAAVVGESMGYRLNSQVASRFSDKAILLESKTGSMSYLVTAHKKDNTIKVFRTPDGLKIEVTSSGTFGAGSTENAKKILAKYKERLMNECPALRGDANPLPPVLGSNPTGK